MRGISPRALLSPAAPWTCRQCLQRRSQAKLFIDFHRFIAKSHRPRIVPRPRRTKVLLASAGSLGAGTGAFFAFSDNAKHYSAAVERSGRVITTLMICVNDYRKTLNARESHVGDWTEFLKACHKRCAERTLRVLEKNGSIFIKLGQHLSSMGYLLPLEWTTTFIPLQDKCPVSSFDSIEEMFIKDTGYSIDHHFDDFEKEPIGAASLAQVHRAKLKDTGREVAVKVQHPSLEEWIPLDLSLTRLSFSSLKYFFPEYDLGWLSNEMEQSLPSELDFSLEGDNAMRTKRYFSNISSTPLIIPEVHWAKRRILVMDYITGHRTDDLAFLDANKIDRDEVSAALAHIFNEMIFGDTALHCDPHGGNIAIRKSPTRRGRHNFDIILYDHGLYRDISKQLRRDYAKLWLAVIDADDAGMRKYSRAVANINDEQFPLFASAITGRDYTAVTNSVVSSRTDSEKEMISGAMGEGLLQQLVQLLGQVPRIILLILKTNDLTRSLDENLHTRQGPVRTFMILARYCSRTVFQEEKEIIAEKGSLFWPSNAVKLLVAWLSYMRVELKLSIYESYVGWKRTLHLEPVDGF